MSLLENGMQIVVLIMAGVLPVVVPVPPHCYTGDGNECRECGCLRGYGNHVWASRGGLHQHQLAKEAP